MNNVDSMETPDNLATLLQNYCVQELAMCHCFHYIDTCNFIL